ncbi:MAG: VCBS repeat-containing protein [Deltaproteobacteria bacterium]|nr:VCBS repeat-containing protein [Deltaproteobacteria bacterium]
MKLPWVVPLLVAACTDFGSIEPNVCGNGIVEAGEDCDADDARCVRCAIVCTASAECPTSDYACGVDGFCHAPGGVLGAASAPVAFQADDLRITDVNGDGLGDVVGVSKTSIVVRFGDAAGALSASESFVTPAQSGPAAFGDVDADGRLDLTLSTADGLVSFTSRFGTLSPIDIEEPIRNEHGEPMDILHMFPIGPQQLGTFIDDGQGRVFLVVIDLLRGDQGVFVDAPCLGRIGVLTKPRFRVDRLDVYQATPRGALVGDLVVSFTTDTGQLCATSIHGGTLTGFSFADVTPPGAALLQQKPVLADLDTDADPCPSLVNSDGGAGALRVWDGRMVGGRCVLDAAGPAGAALPPAPFAPASAVAVGRIPISPAIPTVSSDALVLTNGVYVHAPSQHAFAVIYQSSRRLAKVATADLDNDGDIDAVLAVEGEDDLDVLYRYPLGVELLRLDTAGQVTSITIGDYDGNGIPDIAYTETSTDHQKMMVAYGTPDRPLPGAQVGTFSAIASVTPIQVPDSVDQLAIAEDLFVLQPPAAPGKAPTSTLLHGSPQRTMLSFFDPRADDVRPQTLPRGAVVGNFVDSNPLRLDLLAVATPTPGATVGLLAFRIAGGESGLDPSPNRGVAATGLADCPGGDGVCVDDALYLAFPLSPTRDVVIAVDRATPPHAARLDPSGPASASSLGSQPLPVVTTGVPAGARVRSLHAADVDGDGAPELIASFAGGAQGSAVGSVRACTVAGGVPAACTDLAPLVVGVVPGIVACIDAAPGRVGPRGPFSAPSAAVDLVMLCQAAGNATTPAQSSLFRVFHDGAQLVADPTPLGNAANLRAVRLADVTGDGVDDVIAVQGETSRALLVFPQCSSRDAAACRKTAASGTGGDR